MPRSVAAAIRSALLTADPRDPSFNTAVSGPVNNALGRFGASMADLLTQFFGLGALLGLAVAGVWGLRLAIRAQAPSLWGGRVATLPVVILLLAIALTGVPLPDMAALPAGAGGALGKVSAAALAALLPPNLGWTVGLVSGVLGFGLLVSLFQAATQINESTLSFIPKIVGVCLVLILAGPMLMEMLVDYTRALFTGLPSLIG